MAGSQARTIMTMRADVERNDTATTDAFGHPDAPNFSALATIPCRVHSKSRTERNDTRKTAIVESIRCSMPLGTDVTELDRIAQITDRLGAVLWSGPLRIDTIQHKHTHIEMDLRRIES